MKKNKNSFHSNAVLLHWQTSTSRWLNFQFLKCVHTTDQTRYNWPVANILKTTENCRQLCSHRRRRPDESDCYRAIAQERKEVDSFALQQLDSVDCKMHWGTVLLKDKIVINDAIITSNIC